LELVAAIFVGTKVVPQEAGLLFVTEIVGADIQFNVTGKRCVTQVPVFVATYHEVVAEIAGGVKKLLVEACNKVPPVGALYHM
jgi:hypothetical protein